MNKKKPLGKVVKQIAGHRIRHQVHSVKVPVSRSKSKSKWLPSGEYGLYAGKKLLRTAKTIEELL